MYWWGKRQMAREKSRRKVKGKKGGQGRSVRLALAILLVARFAGFGIVVDLHRNTLTLGAP